MIVPYFLLALAFVIIVIWMIRCPKDNKLQEYFAIALLWTTLFVAMSQNDEIIIASIGFVSFYLAAINHYYKSFIGV